MIGGILLGLVLAIIFQSAKVKLSNQIPAQKEEIKMVETIDYPKEAWLYSLMRCESEGNPTATNPRDLDNTPSYGCYQFKPKTIRYFGVKYGLLPDNLEEVDYINWAYDCKMSKRIVEKMLDDLGVKYDVIDVTEKPEYLQKYSIYTAPGIVIDDKLEFVGIPKNNDGNGRFKRFYA